MSTPSSTFFSDYIVVAKNASTAVVASNSTEDKEEGEIEEGNITCILCFHPFYQPVVTPCGHMYCQHCIVRALASDPRCPLCRRNLLATPPPPLPVSVAPDLQQSDAEEQVDGERERQEEEEEGRQSSTGGGNVSVATPRHHHRSLRPSLDHQLHAAESTTTIFQPASESLQQICQAILVHCYFRSEGCLFEGTRAEYQQHCVTSCPQRQAKAASLLRISIGNTWRSINNPNCPHGWTAYVKPLSSSSSVGGAQQSKMAVKKVIFHLHPTFPDRHVTCPATINTSHASPFQVSRLGWGYFTIHVEVHVAPLSAITSRRNVHAHQNSTVVHRLCLPLVFGTAKTEKTMMLDPSQPCQEWTQLP